MEHSEVMDRQIGERYLLDELSAAEAEQFEAHYFSCSECAADLEAGELLIENARYIFQEEERGSSHALSADRQPGLRSWWRKLAAAFRLQPMVAATSFASLALAGICLYQALVLIPQSKREAEGGNTAIALPSFQLVGPSRGETAILTVPHSARFFAVSFDIDPQITDPVYRCDLKDSTGSIRFTVPSPAPPPGQPISVLFPTRGLQSGRFQLVLNRVRAASVVNVSVYDFELEFK